MKHGISPNPNNPFPIKGVDYVCYVKPIIKNPNVIVGDFTYISDSDFERHISHHYAFNGDKLIIGNIFEGWNALPPTPENLPLKGDTIIGNDVWIGQNATILPGVHIGDGAIIGANSVVGSNVAPYSIVVGNPAKEIKKRFDEELISLLLAFQWWEKSIDEIQTLIPLLTCSDLQRVKKEIKQRI